MIYCYYYDGYGGAGDEDYFVVVHYDPVRLVLNRGLVCRLYHKPNHRVLKDLPVGNNRSELVLFCIFVKLNVAYIG
jgi:hypothetical protein